VRVLGIPVSSPYALAERTAADVAAFERLLRDAPRQIDRALRLAEELVEIGQRVLEIAERLDGRAETILKLGERLDRRAGELLVLGGEMRALGGQIDARGAEIVERATAVSTTATELIAVLPTLERAIDLATPLEGAIDRFGRLVDRFPGAAGARRQAQAQAQAEAQAERKPATESTGRSTRRPAPRADR
jgi:hypothetical protein